MWRDGIQSVPSERSRTGASASTISRTQHVSAGGIAVAHRHSRCSRHRRITDAPKESARSNKGDAKWQREHEVLWRRRTDDADKLLHGHGSVADDPRAPRLLVDDTQLLSVAHCIVRPICHHVGDLRKVVTCDRKARCQPLRRKGTGAEIESRKSDQTPTVWGSHNVHASHRIRLPGPRPLE